MSLETLTEKVEQLIDKADLLKTVSGINFRNNTEITDLTLDCKNFTMINAMCLRCTKLNTVNLSNTKNNIDWTACFQYCNNLDTVKTLDFSSATSATNCFGYCNKITNIEFVPETIPVSVTIASQLLTDESIQSIIDGLATVEETRTLTVHGDIMARLTEEHWTSTVNKNWMVE